MKGLKQNSGFTMMELIIVMIILAIISAVTYIRWSESTTFLDQQTTLFASDLRYAQNLSVTRNERYRLEITFPNKYKILDNEGNSQVIPPDKGDPNNDNIVELEHQIFFKQPIGIITDTIIFDGKGTPYKDTNPETQLDQDLIITLQNHEGKTRNIYISKITGKVSIYSP